MKSIYTELLAVGEYFVDTEILEISLDSEGYFKLVFEYWPDVFEYSGNKAQMTILAKGASIKEPLDAECIVGYEVRDIAVENGGTEIRIDTTIRRIDLVAEAIEFIPKLVDFP